MIAAVLLLVSCRELEDAPVREVAVYDATPYALAYGGMAAPVIPADNPLHVQGVALGRMLFYERRLSRTGTLTCASCHMQEHAFSDPRKFSLGVDQLPGKRHAMAVFNMAWNTNGFFWDGRAPFLRDQSLKPIQDHLEMDESLANVVEKLRKLPRYEDQFMRAFGSSDINALRISLALEQFMNSIVSSESKYDLYLRGDVMLSDAELRGKDLFFQEYNPFFPNASGADCQHCHGGLNFENDEFRNNGLDLEADLTDIGYEAVTGNLGDRGKFKVPTLRNIDLTAPYMHDGRFQSLEEVVDHYNSGIQASNTLDVTLGNTLPNGLLLTDEDKANLVAFLHTLTDLKLTTNPAYGSPF